jgi:hypothetical protein
MTDTPKPEEPVQVDWRWELTALRAANAPVIYFDSISSRGAYMGMAAMTLECGLHLVGQDGKSVNGRQVVAHVRFPLARLALLRDALNAIELLAKPAQKGPKN